MVSPQVVEDIEIIMWLQYSGLYNFKISKNCQRQVQMVIRPLTLNAVGC